MRPFTQSDSVAKINTGSTTDEGLALSHTWRSAAHLDSNQFCRHGGLSPCKLFGWTPDPACKRLKSFLKCSLICLSKTLRTLRVNFSEDLSAQSKKSKYLFPLILECSDQQIFHFANDWRHSSSNKVFVKASVSSGVVLTRARC